MQPLVEQPADRSVGKRIDMLEAHHACVVRVRVKVRLGLGLGIVGIGIG